MGRYYLVRIDKLNDRFSEFGNYPTVAEARKAAYRAISKDPYHLRIDVCESNSFRMVGSVSMSHLTGERSWVTEKMNEYELKSDGSLGKSLYRECRSRR